MAKPEQKLGLQRTAVLEMLGERSFPKVCHIGPKCWADHVREDLEALGMLLCWSRLARARNAWRDRLHNILGHPQQNADIV